MSGDLEDGPTKGQQWGLCRWTGVGRKLGNGPFLGPRWEDVRHIHPLSSHDPDCHAECGGSRFPRNFGKRVYHTPYTKNYYC